jgi:hypothetical protein
MFSIDTRHLPHLRNYAEAEWEYNSIKPVRGTYDVRPLERTRNQNKRIEKRGEDYRAVLHQTACVIYHPDDSITVDGTWTSRSTCGFINAVSPFSVEWRDTLYLTTDSGTWNISRRPVTFRKVDDVWTPDNPVQETIRVLDKTRARPVQKALAPLKRWVKTLDMLDVTPPATGWIDYTETARLLHALLDGTLPSEQYAQLLRQYRTRKSDGIAALTRDAYKAAGAIVEEVVPLGTMPKKTKY